MAKNKKKYCVSLGVDNMDTNQHPSICIYNQTNCMMQVPRKKAFIIINTAEYDSTMADNDALVQPISTFEDFERMGFCMVDYNRAHLLPIGGVYDYSRGISLWANNDNGNLGIIGVNHNDNSADYDGIYIMRVI